MKISGSHTLQVGREQVFEALQDPAMLVRTLPGCQTLEVTGEGAYAATLYAGVASIKGTYHGEVRMQDQQPPERYTLRASGQGTPGTVDATAVVLLSDHADGGTVVEYEADAVIGGPIGGVGQRVISGVAKKTAGEFFSAVERELTGAPALAPAAAPAPAPAGAPAPGAEQAAPALGQVFRAPAPPPGAPTDVTALLAAAVAGALIALLGVLVGRRTARQP